MFVSSSCFTIPVPMREVSCVGYIAHAWGPQSLQPILRWSPLYFSPLQRLFLYQWLLNPLCPGSSFATVLFVRISHCLIITLPARTRRRWVPWSTTSGTPPCSVLCCPPPHSQPRPTSAPHSCLIPYRDRSAARYTTFTKHCTVLLYPITWQFWNHISKNCILSRHLIGYEKIYDVS